MTARRSDGKFVSKSQQNEAAAQEVAAVLPPLPPTDLPGPQNPQYHPSDDGRATPEDGPNPELAELRQQIADLNARLAEQQESVQAQRNQALVQQPANVGPSGLPAGLYPERANEQTQARSFPRGLLVHEVIEMDRLEAEQRALDNIAAGLPPVPQPLPPGTVTATREEFEPTQ